jgi:hypothetical protein
LKPNQFINKERRQKNAAKPVWRAAGVTTRYRGGRRECGGRAGEVTRHRWYRTTPLAGRRVSNRKTMSRKKSQKKKKKERKRKKKKRGKRKLE